MLFYFYFFIFLFYFSLSSPNHSNITNVHNQINASKFFYIKTDFSKETLEQVFSNKNINIVEGLNYNSNYIDNNVSNKLHLKYNNKSVSHFQLENELNDNTFSYTFCLITFITVIVIGAIGLSFVTNCEKRGSNNELLNNELQKELLINYKY